MAAPLLAVLFASAAFAGETPTIDFDAAPNGADTATLDWPGVSIEGALVLDEATIEALTLHAASGVWATSGTQGLLNSLSDAVTIDAHGPFEAFSVEVIGLPRPDEGFFLVEAQLFHAGEVVDTLTSDGVTLGDSGLHEARFDAADFFADRLVLRTVFVADCGDLPCIEPSEQRDSLFLDDLTIEFVPEPDGVVLGLGAVLGLAALRRVRR